MLACSATVVLAEISNKTERARAKSKWSDELHLGLRVALRRKRHLRKLALTMPGFKPISIVNVGQVFWH